MKNSAIKYDDYDTGAVHVFRVQNKSDKNQIKKSVENIFNVKVVKVGIVNSKGKVKSFKNRTGKQKDWKKAYVRLATGCEIDYSKYNMTR